MTTMTSAQGRASRRKGKTGEREFLRFCAERGIAAHRTSEFVGDVILEPPPRAAFPQGMLGKFYLVEVKYCALCPAEIARALETHAFVAQRMPYVPWRIHCRLITLLFLAAETITLPESAHSAIVTLAAEDWTKMWNPLPPI